MPQADDVGRRIDERLAQWNARLDRVDVAQSRPVSIESPVRAEPPAGHVLFVPSPAGYELVEGDGTTPSTGQRIELVGREGSSYAVTRVVRSPLPGDRRRCAYLELT